MTTMYIRVHVLDDLEPAHKTTHAVYYSGHFGVKWPQFEAA